jgi:hypothetical protein
MNDKIFVIADEDGKPEGITDPLTLVDAPPAPDPKPKPGPKRPTFAKQDPTPKRPGRPSKSDLEREVQLEIQAMIMLGSSIWANYDDICAPVLSKQSTAISASLATILAKHPALLARMRDVTGLGDYLGLAVAILPVVQAISKHHVQNTASSKEDVPNGQ